VKLMVSSGDYREVIEFATEDRKVAHRLGCIAAVESGKELGRVIRSSVHLSDDEIRDDDLWSLTEAIEEILEGSV